MNAVHTLVVAALLGCLSVAAQAQTQVPTTQAQAASLAQQNESLIIENLELSQRVATLETQVAVLSEERTAELYTRGAVFTFLALVAGFVAAMLLMRKKSSW